LKYETNKAAEVGRLIQILGRLARGMAGLEIKSEDVPAEAPGGGEVATPVGEVEKTLGGQAPAQAGKGGAAGGAGGTKKGKKGKK